MKTKFLLLTTCFAFLIGIYGWKCTSIQKTRKKKKQEHELSQTPATDSNLVFNPATGAAPMPSNSSGTINISTAHPVALYKDIHSACTVDIFFSKRMQTRNILDDPYFSFIKSFNFTSLQYSGGSTADHEHAIIGDSRVSGGKGDGYNISAEDCRARGEDINAVLDGIGTAHFGVDFFNEYCALLNKLSIPGDLVANVQGGTLDELVWKIQQSHAHRVIFGMEQNLPSNAHDFPDGNAYKAKVSKWMVAVKQKFPNIIIATDAAPIYRENSRFEAWNEAIQNMPADEVRLYLWDKDAAYWQPDQNQNLVTMNEVFNTTFPQWLQQMQTRFPGKKVSVWQWGLKPKTDVFNTMAACIYIAKFYKFMIDYNKANNNFIGYASFMSLKSLDRGDGYTLAHADALRACGRLFSGNKRVLDISIGLNGVSGVACDENGKYTVLLINETAGEVSVPNISINNTQMQGKNFTVTSVHASSLGGTDVSEDTKTVHSISLHPYSVNVVEF